MIIPLAPALLRLGAAAVLGAVIGVEREWRHKTAGIKTNTLVALGSAGFALVSDTFGPSNHNPAQLAAAVVSGIGFIGAGVIIHRGATVQGVTTAATLWANASMGVAIGIGQYYVAAALFLGIVFAQFMMRRAGVVMTRLNNRSAPARFEVRVDCEAESLRALNDAWIAHAEAAKFAPLRRSVHRGAELVTWKAVFRTQAGPTDLSRFEEALVALEGVRSVQLRHLGVEEE